MAHATTSTRATQTWPARTELTPDIPKVLAKSLQVLEAFGSESPRWSESDLRRQLGIPSSTLHRILRALEQTGYVLRDDGGHYRLGIAVVAQHVAGLLERSEDPVKRARRDPKLPRGRIEHRGDSEPNTSST